MFIDQPVKNLRKEERVRMRQLKENAQITRFFKENKLVFKSALATNVPRVGRMGRWGWDSLVVSMCGNRYGSGIGTIAELSCLSKFRLISRQDPRVRSGDE